jgi:hypothetical protein
VGGGGGRKVTDVNVVRLVIILYRVAQEKGGHFLVSVPVRVVLLVIKKKEVLYYV